MTSLLFKKTPVQSRHKEVILQPVIFPHFSASTNQLHYYLSFNKWSHFYFILKQLCINTIDSRPYLPRIEINYTYK